MSYQRDRAEFTAILAQELPDRRTGEVAALAERFMRLANKSARYAVRNCNVGLTEREDELDSKNDKAMESLAASVGFGAIISGDPRGAVLKLTVPSGRTNDWGQEGICVPTREY